MEKINWHVPFANFLSSQETAKFRWGENDCLLFTLRCVEIRTGVFLAPWIIGKYYDEQTAYDLIEEYCGSRDIEYAFDKGLPEAGFWYLPNKLMATRGDVVIFGDPKIAGVVDLSGTKIMSIGPMGIMRVELNKSRKVWTCRR